MAKTPKTYRMSDDVVALLEESSGETGATELLEQLVRDRRAEWSIALAHLRAGGWTPVELELAFQALDGSTAIRIFRPGSWIAHEIAEYGRLRGLPGQVTVQRWAELYRRVADDSTLEGQALLFVSRAWHSGDAECSRRVRG